MRKVMNVCCVGLAFIAIGLGSVGIFLPILPTVPFYLLATALLAKGSPRFHRWFLSSKLYEKYLADFVETKAATVRTKIQMLLFITLVFTLAFFLCPVWIGKWAIGIVAFFHYIYILRNIKTLSEREIQTLKTRRVAKKEVSK